MKKDEANAIQPWKKEIHEKRVKLLKEISEYARKKYREILEKILEPVKEKFPEYFHNGIFVGHITSNSMEGGNWRVKYAIRLLFKRADTAAGKSVFAVIKDSVVTMRRRKNKISPAQRFGLFTFARVMG